MTLYKCKNDCFESRGAMSSTVTLTCSCCGGPMIEDGNEVESFCINSDNAPNQNKILKDLESLNRQIRLQRNMQKKNSKENIKLRKAYSLISRAITVLNE